MKNVPTWTDVKVVLEKIEYDGNEEDAKARFEQLSPAAKVRAHTKLLELNLLMRT